MRVAIIRPHAGFEMSVIKVDDDTTWDQAFLNWWYKNHPDEDRGEERKYVLTRHVSSSYVVKFFEVIE